jgi:hypothetical protein
MPGERRGLAPQPLHHVAVAAEHVDVIVEQLEPGPVVCRRKPAPGDGHPDAHGDALAERAGGGLDPGRPAVFRVPGTATPRLAEALDVVQRHRGPVGRLIGRVRRADAGQVDQAVEQHGGMARGEHEPVAVGPVRVLGVVAQHPLPEGVRRRRHPHGRAGVPGLRLLHGIDRERPDRVYAELVEIRRRHAVLRSASALAAMRVIRSFHEATNAAAPSR